MATHNASEPVAGAGDPVIVSLDDLRAGVCDNQLPDAFGAESLGIIIVNNLPSRYVALRAKLLALSTELAALPADALAALEAPECNYLVGWSCGKEKLADGAPDTLKGSFYANCAFYVDPALECAPLLPGHDPDLVRGYTTANLWPPLAEFRDTFRELCTLIIDVSADVARACDRYLAKTLPDFPPGYLEHVVTTSTTTKARLLHYFPVPAGPAPPAWCGEHLDHGTLTGLTAAMYLDAAGGPELPASPDPAAGLYIRDRRGHVVRVAIPRDALAFQTGQALQQATQGRFRAVPHFVRGSAVPDVARNTLAVFCQPSLHEPVGAVDFATFAAGIVAANVVEG
ncbi:uncharacterized protein V1510DRAFT_430685 [Dipodascopsis tothii]|uniref:uncharacterized protein n=1 Tax=Dipodascopsis tothii TaxID=44089 RepID=UPI0034CD7E34